MALRLASTEVKRLDLGDGDWVEVAADISKRDFNRLAAAMPENLSEDDSLTLGQATELTQTLFEIFVRGWSLPVPVDSEQYLSLASESASVLDGAVMEHFNSLSVTPDEAKKPKTSRRT